MRKSSLVFVPLCFVVLPALAAEHCTPQTTQGFWEYTCEGYLPALPPAPAGLVPARLLGTCTASGTAYWSCLGSANIGGVVLEQAQALQGQAVNDPDCTGTISYTQTIFGQPAGYLNIRYVIWDNGGRITGLPVDSGQLLACVLHRISNAP